MCDAPSAVVRGDGGVVLFLQRLSLSLWVEVAWGGGGRSSFDTFDSTFYARHFCFCQGFYILLLQPAAPCNFNWSLSTVAMAINAMLEIGQLKSPWFRFRVGVQSINLCAFGRALT